MRTLRTSSSALTAAVLSATLLTAQSQSQQPPAQPPTFRTGSNLVRVDVYPTRDGQPVVDLAATDFEISEDGVPQKVATFEHVVVRPAGPQSERVEPGSQRDMLQAAANPRNRVFVIFLDAPNVSVSGSHDIAEPIIRLINRILGPDDLVGIMTPDMSASDVVLSRRTEVTEEQLRKHWTWGGRFSLLKDDREQAYLECYPPLPNERAAESAMARALIDRKRERATLEALQDLVRYLNGIREERKAILTVTEGWLLYRPDPSLEKLRSDPATGAQDPIPGVDPVGVGPNGKLTTKDPRRTNPALSRMECDADRQRLAAMDDDSFFRDIIDDANRVNASFYAVDPRGLVAFDTPINQGLSVVQDARSLRTRQEAMRTLAEATDGLAVMGSNDLDKGLRRISDDLTSYYLLGYYSTNTKLDGGYRSLKVRVTRPGVGVRARRGYRAASAEEVAKARAAAAAPVVEVVSPVNAAIGSLGSIRPEARIRLRATALPGTSAVWVTGELSPDAGRADEWAAGAAADVQVTAGGPSAASRVALKPGDRTFATTVTLPAPPTTSVDVQARVTPAGGGPAATDTIHVAPGAQPLFYRRGPTTANRQLPTADVRFTRADRVHLELPVEADVKPASARMLDRTGQPLGVPVTVGERTDGAQRWITADLALAPLAPGDYAVEIRILAPAGESGVVTALRVVR